jgi:hypothetical protein
MDILVHVHRAMSRHHSNLVDPVSPDLAIPSPANNQNRLKTCFSPRNLLSGSPNGAGLELRQGWPLALTIEGRVPQQLRAVQSEYL